MKPRSRGRGFVMPARDLVLDAIADGDVQYQLDLADMQHQQDKAERP